MPVASIDGDGTSLYYEDTGAPPGGRNNYTTFVLLHGLAFNLNTFKKLFPRAQGHGVRIIAMNARGYYGSTPYSEDELLELRKQEAQESGDAVRKWTKEIVAFLVFVVTALGVPRAKKSEGKTTGGFVLVPWSLGNVAATAMLGDPEAVNPQTRDYLSKYLRKIVMFDPPSNVLSVPMDTSVGLYDPTLDPNLSTLQLAATFPAWVSTYYSPVADLSTVTPETLLLRTALTSPPPTIEAMSEDELRSIHEPAQTPHGWVIPGIAPSVLSRNLRNATVDAPLFDGVEIVMLWNEQSIWHCIWSTKHLYNLAQEGKLKRPVSFVRAEGSNHFPHWDRPDGFLKILVDNA